MSGGSYNYLCFKDEHEMFEYGKIEDLEAMASRLIELGYKDAAKEVLNIKYTIQQSLVRVGVMKERMNDVMKAVEWYDSSDSGIDAVEKAISKYRGETE
ncbi:hypothetical protein [Bacillus thuringiensis]|uniref:hypothetical protein n=1 Tax=Bacillus thuringiensis TaxID=1428 RepID=UPI00366C32A4